MDEYAYAIGDGRIPSVSIPAETTLAHRGVCGKVYSSYHTGTTHLLGPDGVFIKTVVLSQSSKEKHHEVHTPIFIIVKERPVGTQ